jgi:hypothetical protein
MFKNALCNGVAVMWYYAGHFETFQHFNSKLLISNVQDGLDLDKTAVNNCILHECTYCWVAVLCNKKHPDDGQQVGVINWENILYYLCVLLVFL